jgi:hypothetical protein
MSLFQIGPEVFYTLFRPDNPAGMPEPRLEQMEVEMVRGLDGVSIPKTGKRGVPFQLFSIRDCASYAVAVARVNAYRQMVAGEWGIIWQDLNLLSEWGTTYVVLSVGQINIKQAINGTGGVSGTSTHLVEAMWTLIATEPSQ